MSEYQLYCFAQSGNAYRAALMLNLLGADWKPIWVDFFGAMVQRTPQFRAEINEMGEAPILVHGREFCGQQEHDRPDHALFQIAAIRRPNVRPQVDEGRQQRSTVCRDARFASRCPMMMMVAHSGSSYKGILASNHPFWRVREADRDIRQPP